MNLLAEVTHELGKEQWRRVECEKKLVAVRKWAEEQIAEAGGYEDEHGRIVWHTIGRGAAGEQVLAILDGKQPTLHEQLGTGSSDVVPLSDEPSPSDTTS